MSEENYYGREEISNSDLGELQVSPRRFMMRKQHELSSKKSAAMELGSLIHGFALEPDKYIMADVAPVGGKMGEYIKAYFQLEKVGTPEDRIPEMAYEMSGYKPSHSKPETILKSFKTKEENIAYYNFLKESDEKIALSQKDRQIIEGCLTSLRGHVVSNKLLFSTTDGEATPEKEIFFNQHGVDCKAKLDRLIVDHDNKTVTVVDLKTTSGMVYGECKKLKSKTGILFRDYHTTGFLFSCLQYHYHRQLAFYIEAAKSLHPDYTIDAYIVAVDTKGSYDVAVYQLPEAWLDHGREDIEKLLTEYKHYKETNLWSTKKGYEDTVAL